MHLSPVYLEFPLKAVSDLVIPFVVGLKHALITNTYHSHCSWKKRGRYQGNAARGQIHHTITLGAVKR